MQEYSALRSAVEISFLPDCGYLKRMTLTDAIYMLYTSAEHDARLNTEAHAEQQDY